MVDELTIRQTAEELVRIIQTIPANSVSNQGTSDSVDIIERLLRSLAKEILDSFEGGGELGDIKWEDIKGDDVRANQALSEALDAYLKKSAGKSASDDQTLRGWLYSKFGAVFDLNIQSGASIASGGKETGSDGKPGVILSEDGNIILAGTGSTIRWYSGNSNTWNTYLTNWSQGLLALYGHLIPYKQANSSQSLFCLGMDGDGTSNYRWAEIWGTLINGVALTTKGSADKVLCEDGTYKTDVTEVTKKSSISTTQALEMTLDNGLIVGLNIRTGTTAQCYVRAESDPVVVNIRRQSIFGGSSEGTGTEATIGTTAVQVDDTVLTESNDAGWLFIETSGATDYNYEVQYWVSRQGQEAKMTVRKKPIEQIESVAAPTAFLDTEGNPI